MSSKKLVFFCAISQALSTPGIMVQFEDYATAFFTVAEGLFLNPVATDIF